MGQSTVLYSTINALHDMPVRKVFNTRYFVWLGGIIMIEQGLPVAFLLLFAVLICVLHLMILFSSPE